MKKDKGHVYNQPNMEENRTKVKMKDSDTCILVSGECSSIEDEIPVGRSLYYQQEGRSKRNRRRTTSLPCQQLNTNKRIKKADVSNTKTGACSVVSRGRDLHKDKVPTRKQPKTTKKVSNKSIQMLQEKTLSKEKHFELDVLKELSTCNSGYISPTNESPLLDNKQTEEHASDTLPDKLLKCKPNTENDGEMKYKSDAIEENKKEAKCMGIIVDPPKLMLKHAKDFNNSEIAKEDLGKVAKDDQAKTLWKFRMTNSAEEGASSDKEKMDDAKEKDDDETEKAEAENGGIDGSLGMRAEVLDLEAWLNGTDSLLSCEDSKLRFESLQEMEMSQDDYDLLQDIERRKEKLKMEDLERERKKKEEIDMLIEKQKQKEVLTVKLDIKPKVEQNCGMTEGDNRLVEEVDNRYMEERDQDGEETNLKKMMDPLLQNATTIMDPAVKKQSTMRYDNNLTEKMDLSEKTVTENNVWHVTDEDHSVDPNTCRVSSECDDGFNVPRESDESDDAVENSCFFSQDDATRPYSVSMTMGSYGDDDGAKSLCIERNQYMDNRGRSQYGQQYMVDDQGNKRSMYSTQTWCSEECIKNKILGTEKENIASNETECEKEKVDREKIESGENSSNLDAEDLESDEGEKDGDIDPADYTRGQDKATGTEYRESLVREIDTDAENIATNGVHQLEAKEKEFETSVVGLNVEENELDVSDEVVDDEDKDNSLDTELSSKHLNKLLSDKEMIRHIQTRLGKMIEDEHTKGEELVQLIKTKYEEIWTLNVAAEHTPIDRELDIMVNQSRTISHNILPGDKHKQGHADTKTRPPTCSKQRWQSPCLVDKNFTETSTQPDKPRKDRRLSMLQARVYGRRCSNSDSGGSGGHHNTNTGDSKSFNMKKDSDNNNNNPNDNTNNSNNNRGRDCPDGNGDAGQDDRQDNEETGNKDVEEANLPPKDYKHFPPGGEHRDAKGHNPMDAIQWANYLGRLTQETKKKGGPIWELHDPDVSVCVSLCLLQPDEMTSDMLSCYICNTVNSLLKHYADCQAVYNSCNMCVQIFSLICSHSYHCGNGYLSNNSDGNPSNSANPSNNGLRSNTEASTKCQIKLCTSIHIHIDSRQFSMHLKTLWCHVRKKLAQMIGSSSLVPPEAPTVAAGPPTLPAPRPHRPSVVNPPSLESIPEGAPLSTVGSRPSSRVLARKKSKLLNVAEQSPAIESANSLPISTPSTAEFARALTGELSEFALAQDAFPTSPSQSGSSDGSDSFGFVNRQQFVSVPVGPPPGAFREYYPSFSDRPVGIKGIGEVVYHDKNQLVLVANHFDRLKIQYQNGETLAKHYREEGVILMEFKDKLCIEGLRYNINFQWVQLTHLGNGMSGKCHLAQDFKTEFNFCVKELHISNYEKEELELWCECDHPYIVQIYGAIRHGEKIYIFMEFVEGGCLTESINVQRELGHRLSQKTALRYFQQLLQVLTYLKGKRILHEDLKADNILLNKGKGKVSIKVADFGLSRRCQATVPKGTKPVGTQTQWSPEKAEGVGYSFSAELWSAICVLVHMLSGLPPWIRRYETIKSLILVIVDKSPPIEDIPRNIDESIKDLIERGFTVCAGQRPTSEALLLHSAFRLLQDDTPTADNYSIIGSFRCMSTQINDDPNADLREIFRGLQDPKAKPNFPVNPMTTVQAYPAMMNTQTLGGVSGQPSDSHNNAMGHNLGHNQHQNSNQSSNVVGASAAIPMNPLGNIDPLEHINSFLSDDQNIYPRPSLTVYLPNEERQNNKSEQHKTSLDIESDVEKNVLPNFDELGIPQFEVENFDDEQHQEDNIFENFDLEKEILNIERQLPLLSAENSRSGNGLHDQEVNMQAEPQDVPQGIQEEKLDTFDEDDLFKSGPSPTPNALTNPITQAINHTSERRIPSAVYPPNTEYQANYTRPKVYPGTATNSASYQHQNPSAMNNHGYSGYTVNNDDEHLNLAPYLSQPHQQEVMQSQHAQFQYVTELNPGSNQGAGIFVGPSMTDDTSRLPGPTPRHELKENMNARNEMLKNQSKSSRNPNDLHIDVKKAQSGPVVYPITQSQTAPTISPPKTPHYYKQMSVTVTSKQTRLSTSSTATTTGSGAMSSKSQYEEEQEQALKLLRDKMNDTLSQHSDHLIWNDDDDEDDDFIDNETNVMERSHTQEDLLEEFGVDLDNPEQSLAHLLDNSIDDGSITVTLKSRSNSAERRIKFTWRDKDKSWYKIIDEDLSRYSELYTDFSVTRFCLRQESAALVDLDDKLGEISLTVYVTEATDDDQWCVESGMIMHS